MRAVRKKQQAMSMNPLKMDNYIDVFMMRVDESTQYKGYVQKIENTLKSMQKEVQGNIEVISLTKEIDLVCNEEGKMEDLYLNRVWLCSPDGVLDVLAGNVFACRHNDKGNFTSILAEDIPVIEQYLKPFVDCKDMNIYYSSTDAHLPEWSEKKNG